MPGDRILALDVGTQSVRAMVFDAAGNVLARTKIPIEPYVPGPPGCCEQDAELYWRALGEATGALDAMLSKVADFYEDEVDNAVSAMTSLMEPLIIAILGGVIGFIVFAMYMPIFNMANVMNK